MSKLTFKTVYELDGDVDIRRIRLPPFSTLVDVVEAVADTYRLPSKSIVLRYVDDEDDWLTLSSNEELEEAINIYNGSDKTLKLFVSISSSVDNVAVDSEWQTLSQDDLSISEPEEVLMETLEKLSENLSQTPSGDLESSNTTVDEEKKPGSESVELISKDETSESAEIAEEDDDVSNPSPYTEDDPSDSKVIEDQIKALVDLSVQNLVTPEPDSEARSEVEYEAEPEPTKPADVTIEDITDAVSGKPDSSIETDDEEEKVEEEDRAPEPAPASEESDSDKDIPFPSRDIIRQLASSFVRDPAVNADLPQAVEIALQGLSKRDPVRKIVDDVTASSTVIASHGFVETLLPHLPKIEDKVNDYIQSLDDQMLLAICHLSRAFAFKAVCIPEIVESAFTKRDSDVDIDLGVFDWQKCGMSPAALQGLLSSFSPSSACSPVDIGFAFEGRTNEEAAPSTCEDESKQSEEPKADVSPPAEPKHSMVYVCDNCNLKITGVRYRCSQCNDFDLCAECEDANVHPPEHVMYKYKPGKTGATIHNDITCDGCLVSPIVGNRYKCTVCYDYDLCEKCEAEGAHEANHPMLKLKVESGHVANLIGNPMRGHKCGRGKGRGRGGFFPKFFRPFQGYRKKKKNGWCKPLNPSPATNAPPAKVPTNTSNTSKSATSTPRTNVPTSSWRRPSPPQARFERDLSFPDRCEVEVGKYIVKTWELTNVGTEAWPIDSKLIFLRGSREICTAEEFPVKEAKPAERVEVSALLKAPETPGRYVTYFRLSDKDRNLFGPRIWVDVKVIEPRPAKEEEHVEPPQPVPSAPADPYAEQVSKLKSMGFSNEILNRYLLEKNNGDVQRVVNWFLNQK